LDQILSGLSVFSSNIALFMFTHCLKCMRKWSDERGSSGWKRTGHLVNAGKYVSCIILVVADTLLKLHPRRFLFPLVPIQTFWLVAAVAKTLSVTPSFFTLFAACDLSDRYALPCSLLCVKHDVTTVSQVLLLVGP
jgi:hypothetical protein